MKITIESTTKIVTLEDRFSRASLQARVWQGQTESGIPVQVFITRIAPDIPMDHPDIDKLTAEFEHDLLRQSDPSLTVGALPLRMII